jgi:hypothetical protein
MPPSAVPRPEPPGSRPNGTKTVSVHEDEDPLSFVPRLSDLIGKSYHGEENKAVGSRKRKPFKMKKTRSEERVF